MKTFKNIILFIVFITASVNKLYSHSQSTHQYIVREAYSLLKKQLGRDIPELEDFIGNNEGRYNCHDPVFNPFLPPYVVAGAWDEDIHDVVFHYDEKYITLISYLREWLSCIAFASVSHFWDPDINPVQKNYFKLWEPPQCTLDDFVYRLLLRVNSNPIIGDFQNAYVKANSYVNGGNWTFIHYEDGYYWKIRWDGFKNMYQNYYWFVEKGWFWFPLPWIPEFKNIYRNFDCELHKYYVYNVLGRICHLLADMSIPAHTHIDEHSCPGDEYENKMNIDNNYDFVTYWDAERVYSESGGYIWPFCVERYDEIKFLFYTTAQIADHYASHRRSGNNNYDDIGEISEILNNATGPMERYSDYTYDSDDNSLGGIRDATLPYVIRATAGLMYWFADLIELINSSGCPFANQYVQNQVLIGRNYLFSAYDNVYIGNSVTQDLPFGDVHIEPETKHVVFRAGDRVIIKSGFYAKKGSDVRVINGCSYCNW